MNKSDLVKAVANESGLTQTQAGEALDATFKVIEASLKKNEKIAITGFGTFEARRREAREGRNPRTGETVKIAARTSAAWKPAAALKEL